MSVSVTIRTSNPQGGDIIDITLEVENGELLNMTAEDCNHDPLDVASIRFTFNSRNTEEFEDRCCVPGPGGRPICYLC